MPEKVALNWLDKIIGYLSPSAALKRLEARHALAKAEASQDKAATTQSRSRPPRSDESEGWRPMSESYERGDWKRFK